MITTSSGEASGRPLPSRAICGKVWISGSSCLVTALTFSDVAPLRMMIVFWGDPLATRVD